MGCNSGGGVDGHGVVVKQGNSKGQEGGVTTTCMGEEKPEEKWVKIKTAKAMKRTVRKQDLTRRE